jgi:hypothetical protein
MALTIRFCRLLGESPARLDLLGGDSNKCGWSEIATSQTFGRSSRLTAGMDGVLLGADHSPCQTFTTLNTLDYSIKRPGHCGDVAGTV